MDIVTPAVGLADRRRLGDVVDRLTNGYVGPTRDIYVDDGVPYLLARHVRDNKLEFDGRTYVDHAFNDKHKKSKLKRGDVLLVQSGHIGHSAVVSSEHEGHNCHAMIVLSPVEGVLVGEYLSYFFNSPEMLATFEGIRSGSTVPHLTCGAVKELCIPVPTVGEQRRIVTLLDEAFEGIATAKAHAEQNLQQASDLFDIALNNLAQAGGPDSTELALSDVCEIRSMLVDPRASPYLDMLHVGAGNIISRTGELIDVLTARQEQLISGKFEFDESMVLYSKIRPYLMKVVRPDFSGLCSADIYPLAPRPEAITRDFLYYILLSGAFTAYAVQGSARAGMPKVNREHLFAYRLRLPPVHAQEKLTEQLDALADNVKNLQAIYQRKLTALTELQQSLLHQAFTGQL